MEKEFVPIDLSLKLKELGFDEPCFGYYDGNRNLQFMYNGYPEKFSERMMGVSDSVWVGWISAPLYQQAFRWIREKYGLYGIPQEYTLDNFSYQIKSNREGAITLKVYGGYPLNYTTYEEAELACLEKLIEIVKSK
jgi:hypothetical protein